MPKILLIDDEKANLRVMSISLRSDGYDVVTACSGEEGLEVYEKERPDIVITDVKMPGIDGIEVLKRIKKRDPESEIIIITGHGDIDNAIEALKHGASDFINKPVRDDAMAVALKRALEKLDIKRKVNEYTENLEKELAEATQELRRQSDFMEKLILTSQEGIVATDKKFNVVIYNPSAEHILGYEPEKVIYQKKAMELLPKDAMRLYVAKRHGWKAIKKLPWKEILVKNEGGTPIPVRFTGTFLYEKKKVMGSVAFMQDLREIKRLEKELLRSERLATIGQTVAGMAHSVKNILHGFKGGSYLMEVGFKKDDTEKLKAGWDMIQKNIRHTSELVMDLLSYSKERQPEYEPCRPNNIARDVCEILEKIAHDHHLEIVQNLDSSIGQVLMDPRSVHSILMNLVSNAVDACIFDIHSEKAWRVTLKTILEKDKIIRFEISDNGIGMTPDVQEKIFSSFFSTKGQMGTGLGLLVTRKLIEEHNGTIDVWSEADKGTTFIVRIPFESVKENSFYSNDH